MTYEQAIVKMRNANNRQDIHRLHGINVISEIYNDLKKQTCENCLSCELDKTNNGIWGWCNTFAYEQQHVKIQPHRSCNLWEAKVKK